ncbi:MAG: hypothetical protein KGJ23_05245 [Euryarchaeota archaeon]|nr:hypothetical protein [Euryarchaeota archaeon]MDE1836005.1 hypothetical protein [Euryarchaeota archaeon]MDE1881600.1 hypothetical protein [Euryarchaeota archaeon]MDE2046003.1 hypothetical protein [Thermoplasmata archaeon]
MAPKRARRARRRPEPGRYIQDYLLFTLDRRRVAFPLLHVRLRGRKGTLRTVALTDSGATSSFVPVEIAEEVGLRLTPGPTAGGGGGDFSTYDGHLSLEVLHRGRVIHRFPHLPVSVPREPGRIPYVVLGRDSIFQAFSLTFEERKGRLVLKRADR